MASCLSNYTLKGIQSDCNPVLAGISEVYLGYYGDFAVSADTTTTGTTRHTITAFSAVSASNKIYKYEFPKNTSSLSDTFTKDEANSVRYFTHTLTLVFSRYENFKHMEVEAMGAEQLFAIVKDYNLDEDGNPQYWFVGFDGYLSADSIDSGTGASADDRNGYELSFSCTSAYMPFKIDYDKFKNDIYNPNAQ